MPRAAWKSLTPGPRRDVSRPEGLRSDAAEEIFPKLTIFGWTFDVEALFLARSFGFTITEIPIQWHHHPHSTVKVLRDSIQMGLDVMKIRWNAIKGVYKDA